MTVPPVLRQIVDSELSLPSRLAHVALLLVALMMTGIIASLWLTEPELPQRTRVAFAVMVTIGLSWAVFALWVLTHRRILLARHQIVAGRMAVTCSGLFVLGAVGVAAWSDRPAAYGAVAVGLGMLTAAGILLARAHRTFNRLSERRQELERRMQ